MSFWFANMLHIWGCTFLYRYCFASYEPSVHTFFLMPYDKFTTSEYTPVRDNPQFDTIVTSENCFYYLSLLEQFYQIEQSMSSELFDRYIVAAEKRYLYFFHYNNHHSTQNCMPLGKNHFINRRLLFNSMYTFWVLFRYCICLACSCAFPNSVLWRHFSLYCFW